MTTMLGGRRATVVPLLLLAAVIAVLLADVGVLVSAIPSREPRTVLGDRTGFSPGAGILADQPADLARELDVVVASGAGRLRIDMDWSQLEPAPGRYEWDSLDRVVKAADERGLQVLGLLTYTPQWARPAGTSTHAPPLDPERFAAFASAAVRRYRPRGVLAYEVWNEPNIPQFWEPTPQVAAYVRLLQAASRAIRAAAPDATVVSGGLAPASDDGPNGQLDPRTFLERLYAAGAGPSLDAVAVHPYSYPALPSDVLTARFNTFQKLTDVRATMVARGDAGKQVWLTEVGAPTGDAPGAVSPERQAAIIVDAVRSAAALPWTGPVFVYAVRDAGEDPQEREDNFGLVRRDFAPKPAWRRLRELLRA